MGITPRGWQASALPVVTSTLRSGKPALVSACTGAGKSWFLAFLLQDVLGTLRDGWAVVVTVPTEALVEQLAATLRQHLGSAKVGRWYGRVKRMRTVTVCCLPSMESLVVELAMHGQRCALWIGDEVHRAEAYAETIDLLGPRARLGVTATPYRSTEGLTMWPELTYRYTMREAIADGVLVPIARRVPPASLGEDVDVDEATLWQIQHQAPPGPGVVSAATVDDAEAYAGYLRAAGVEAMAIHSRLSSRERKAALAGLQSGAYRCLVHVRVLSEGVDLPWLRWLVLRTSHSRTRVGLVQEIGRVLRIDPDDPTKREGYVLDPLDLMASVGIEHPEDLVSAADGAETETERKARETRELITLEEDARKAVLHDELSAWLAERRYSMMGPSPVEGRDGPPTPKQMAELEKRAKAMRWLGEETRARVRGLIETDRLTAATAWDVIAVLRAASGAVSKHRAEGGSWRTAPRLELEG